MIGMILISPQKQNTKKANKEIFMQEFTSNNLPMTDSSSVFAPITIVGGVILAIGLIIIAVGIGLAIYLKKKSK